MAIVETAIVETTIVEMAIVETAIVTMSLSRNLTQNYKALLRTETKKCL